MIKSKFKVQSVLQNKDYGKFILEPLERSYGDTLGTALRRCLLTSLEGSAVTEVRIEGVRHQFSTLEGLKEDIVQLILNIKQLRINYKGEQEAIIKLEEKGPKVVTARDIKAPAEIEIINKDLVLANLADKKAKLSVEMKVVKGWGYSPAEERAVNTVGVIPIDASFSPIKRVNYKVESTRVGRRTDFDRLILEIWTDGTIKPQEALTSGAKILVNYFKQIYEPVFSKEVEEKKPLENNEALSLTIEELDLPTRIVNALSKGGYKTLKDLTQAKSEEIASLKNLGVKSISLIEEKLKEKGLSFNDVSSKSS